MVEDYSQENYDKIVFIGLISYVILVSDEKPMHREAI